MCLWFYVAPILDKVWRVNMAYTPYIPSEKCKGIAKRESYVPDFSYVSLN